jgi:hypothetical protein
MEQHVEQKKTITKTVKFLIYPNSKCMYGNK